MQPLISICIPTFNRASYLSSTLHSITRQSIFIETDYFEIVISDNCSTDATEELCKDFEKRYAGKLKYFRNEQNQGEKNFELCLSRGRGQFLKLTNDSLLHRAHSLAWMFNLINDNLAEKNLVFFSNSNYQKAVKLVRCKDVDEFLQTVSITCTWLGGFGIWKTDFDAMADFGRRQHLQLMQTDVLFRQLRQKKMIVFENRIYDLPKDIKKGNYDRVQIFLVNYVFLLKELLDEKRISEKTFKQEKRNLLVNLLLILRMQNKVDPKKYSHQFNRFFYHMCIYYKDDWMAIVLYFLKSPIIYLKLTGEKWYNLFKRWIQ